MVLTIAAIEDMEVEQMDAVTAFLNPDIEEEIYMEQPEGFAIAGQEHLVCRLCRNLYGLKQSPRNWNQLHNAQVKQLGFVQSNADHCIYTLHAQDPKSALYLLLYVDDIILASKSIAQLNHIQTELSKQFKLTDTGALGLFLGMEITRDCPSRRLWLSQKHFLQKVLPALAWTTANQHDLAASVGSVIQFMANPGPGHWHAVKHILRYMSGTLDAVLELGGSFSTAPDLEGTLTLTGLAAQTPGTPSLACLQVWRHVALCSTEAEYMVLTLACQEVIWLRQLLIELAYPQFNIYEDNQGCITLARNPTSHTRTKHIHIGHHFICKATANQHVDLEYCPIKDIAADKLAQPQVCRAV
ncbi:DNA-directed DNA polymerase [Powellomyces hirtus]|uniref:DNA-directed DNA polymerase n=1 Tax=Powellomyces hirtus TaxID=109895 RepID=A0A507DPM4_9FUNG|nr:DNA-directed DNA polymerase [Powellomyces hirtus]